MKDFPSFMEIASRKKFFSKVKIDFDFRYTMSTNNQRNFENSSSTDPQINTTDSITTNQLQSDRERTSAEIEEIDVAQADQSDR